jgi:hypothetical protein
MELADLKVGQVLKLTEAQKEKLALLPPSAASLEAAFNGDPSKYGIKVDLKDKEKKSLCSFIIGKAFARKSERSEMFEPGGYPDGQYIQTGEGKTYLVSKILNRWDDSHGAWLENDFINVPSTNILSIVVEGKDRAQICLSRTNTQESFKLTDLKEEEGILDNMQANSMAGALGWLSFDDVADPALPAELSGLTNPAVFTVKTQQGIIYKLSIGNPVSSSNPDRYAKVNIAFDKTIQVLPAVETNNPGASTTNAPVLPDFEKEAKSLNDKLSRWIYILKSYRVDNMLKKRESLIKKPEPPSTNTVANATQAISASINEMAVPETIVSESPDAK